MSKMGKEAPENTTRKKLIAKINIPMGRNRPVGCLKFCGFFCFLVLVFVHLFCFFFMLRKLNAQCFRSERTDIRDEGHLGILLCLILTGRENSSHINAFTKRTYISISNLIDNL